MPLPLIPLLIGGASLIAGGYGIKKGMDAKEDFEKAESIGERAKDRHRRAVNILESEKEKTNREFAKLGELKVHIFSNQIKRLVDEIKKAKSARASLKDFEQVLQDLDLPQMERMIRGSLEIEQGLASGVVSGALMGLGAYGSVGMLASASTGTAIATLSGAAASNATLAWLGGGALSAGGLGVAGGTAVLGGLVVGPAIAITGFVMASKAEEALSKAYAYEAEVDKAIAEIDTMKCVLNGLQKNSKEMESTLKQLTAYFDRCVEEIAYNDKSRLEKIVAVGTALKRVLDTPILEKDGSAVKNLKSKLSVITSGILQYQG